MSTAIDMTGLAIGLLTALAIGMAAVRLRQPPLVGYLVAGMVLGPGGFAVAGTESAILGFAEFFIVVFLFAAGIELGARARPRIWRNVAVAVAGLLAAGLVIVAPLALLLGWPVPTALLLGFVLVFSGIAPALGLARRSGAGGGRIVAAMLIAQAVVFLPLALIFIDIGGDGFRFATLLKGALAAALVAAAIAQLSRRPRITLPLFGLLDGGAASALFAALVFCFAGAAMVGLLGLPPAYGAFLAGLVVANSTARGPVLTAVRPIRGILALAFFLFLGLLTDLAFVWDNIGSVIALLVVATAIRTVLPAAILQRMGESWPLACRAGVLTAAPGELAVALAVAALAAGSVAADGARLAFAVIALGLLLCPLWLFVAGRLRAAEPVPVDSLGELYDATFGAEAEKIREQWRSPQAAPGAADASAPPQWEFPVDDFGADAPDEPDEPDEPNEPNEFTELNEADELNESAEPAEPNQPDEPAEPPATGEDAFAELGDQVREAARNGDGPAPSDAGDAGNADHDEDGKDGEDDKDGYRPPRPDA